MRYTLIVLMLIFSTCAHAQSHTDAVNSGKYVCITTPEYAMALRDSVVDLPGYGLTGFYTYCDSFGNFCVDTPLIHFFEESYDTMFLSFPKQIVWRYNYQLVSGDAYQMRPVILTGIKVRDGLIPQKDTATITGSTTYTIQAGRVLLLYRIAPVAGSVTVSVGTTLGGTDIVPATNTSTPLTLLSGLTFDTDTILYITITGGTACRHIRMKI